MEKYDLMEHIKDLQFEKSELQIAIDSIVDQIDFHLLAHNVHGRSVDYYWIKKAQIAKRYKDRRMEELNIELGQARREYNKICNY